MEVLEEEKHVRPHDFLDTWVYNLQKTRCAVGYYESKHWGSRW